MATHSWQLSTLGNNKLSSVNIITATGSADLIVTVTNEGADAVVVRTGNTVLRTVGSMQSGAVRCNGDVDIVLAEGSKSAKGYFSLIALR